MTDRKKDTIEKNDRILSFKVSQEFTASDLKVISGSAKQGTCMITDVYTQSIKSMDAADRMDDY